MDAEDSRLELVQGCAMAVVLDQMQYQGVEKRGFLQDFSSAEDLMHHAIGHTSASRAETRRPLSHRSTLRPSASVWEWMVDVCVFSCVDADRSSRPQCQRHFQSTSRHLIYPSMSLEYR